MINRIIKDSYLKKINYPLSSLSSSSLSSGGVIYLEVVQYLFVLILGCEDQCYHLSARLEAECKKKVPENRVVEMGEIGNLGAEMI